ncbi:hypothetical protein [Chlamydia vaughanii]|uniref:hypothetical protein n=1 Tax=Chlamydia vaughanii TaxID=3112552 RepID=UPI0032B1C989
MTVHSPIPNYTPPRNRPCCDVRNTKANRIAGIIAVFISIGLIGSLFTLLIHFGVGSPTTMMVALGIALATSFLLICIVGYYFFRHDTSLNLLARQEENLQRTHIAIEALEKKISSFEGKYQPQEPK